MLLLSLAPSFSEWRITTPQIQPFATTNGLYTPSSSSSSSSGAHGTNDSTLTIPAVTPVWWLSSPTSYGQSILFLVSATYFALDIIALQLRGRFHTSKGQRILTHHLLSILGLISPIISGLDGPLVLLGFVLAECSNPPFHALTLCKYATKQNMRLRCASPWMKMLAKPVIALCLSMDLSLVHVLIFVLSRLACLQFTAHAVMPFANILVTKVTSILLCLLSVAQFVDLCKTLQLGGSNGSSPAHGGSGGGRKHGWKQVMAEMRELQSECDSTGTFATYGAPSSSSSSASSSSSSTPLSSTPNGSRKGSTDDGDRFGGGKFGRHQRHSGQQYSSATNSPARQCHAASPTNGSASGDEDEARRNQQHRTTTKKKLF